MILEKYIDRFWTKVDKTSNPNGCWIFGNHKSYASIGPEYNRMGAHRFSYIIHKGEIPEGLFVCHTCDNPTCVNPEHLWLGDNKENTTDRHIKGRSAKGSYIGTSKLTETDVYIIRSTKYHYGLIRKLAKQYNVREDYISKVRSGQGWNHIKV